MAIYIVCQMFCRKHTIKVNLTNSTLLPVAWKLSGLDQLGEEFSFNQDHGIVPPRSDFPLHVHFRAAKPVTIKKAFKLEVYIYMYIYILHTCIYVCYFITMIVF